MFATPLRFSKGHQAAIGAGGKLPLYGNGRREGGPARKSGPVLSGTAYCLSSCSMILLNKIVLSSYDFNAGISLMFYQVSLGYYFLPSSISLRKAGIRFNVSYHDPVVIYNF